MDLKTQLKLLKLKDYLNKINHISYTYSEIGKNNPMINLTEKKALFLIEVYEDLLNQVKNLILNYENELKKQLYTR